MSLLSCVPGPGMGIGKRIETNYTRANDELKSYKQPRWCQLCK